MSDGSRLALEDDGPGGRAGWMLLGDSGAEDRELSVADAVRVAGEQHADYVRIRTRSEVAWLRLVSEWFEQEAQRLGRDLQTASPQTAATKPPPDLRPRPSGRGRSYRGAGASRARRRSR